MVSIRHEGRDWKLKELYTKNKNVTRREVEIFIRVCEPCQQE